MTPPGPPTPPRRVPPDPNRLRRLWWPRPPASAAALLPQRLAITGAVVTAIALGIVVVRPLAAAGWLTAFVFWASLPIGGLLLVMMMRIIPGGWRESLGPLAVATLRLMPLAALTAIPVLAGLPALYPWVDRSMGTGFRGVYLTPWFFVLRTLLFFLIAGTLAWQLRRSSGRALGVAAVGLILLVCAHTPVAVDWLASRDPGFHSSGFGLYLLSIQTTVALAALIVARLTAPETPGRPAARPAILGGLLFTTLLLWAYFAFMQYFISWSGNLPANIPWYLRRSEGAWRVLAYLIGLLGLAPAALLLFTPIRHGRRWLVWLGLAVLAGKILEVAWLALADGPVGAVTLLVAVLALIGLGGPSLAVLVAAARLPAPSRRATVTGDGVAGGGVAGGGAAGGGERAP